MDSLRENRRLAATDAILPPGVTPKGTSGLILNAALRLFAEHGYGATSIRDIVAEAGIQPASLYSHYPSKEHLLAEIARIGNEELHQRLRAALLECPPDPREQLVALVSTHARLHANYAVLAVVINSELHALSAQNAAPALALRRESEKILAELVERGLRMGVFNVANPQLARLAITAMGVRVANWYSPELGLSPEAVGAQFAEFALRILGASSAAGA
jgi:AcrR family transcriptional regulator